MIKNTREETDIKQSSPCNFSDQIWKTHQALNPRQSRLYVLCSVEKKNSNQQIHLNATKQLEKGKNDHLPTNRAGQKHSG